MNLSSHLVQRAMKLDPPMTRDLVVEHDLPVPMPDGAVLLADVSGAERCTGVVHHLKLVDSLFPAPSPASAARETPGEPELLLLWQMGRCSTGRYSDAVYSVPPPGTEAS